MNHRARPAIDEARLSKGQLRKLSALRKSLGKKIADNAFADWLKHQALDRNALGGNAQSDVNAAAIRKAVEAVVLAGQARIPRGGYLIRRGRGRVILEPPTKP